VEVRSAEEVAELARSPIGTELMEDAAVVVEVDRGLTAEQVSWLARLPRVVVGIGTQACPAVDVVVADDRAAEEVVDAVCHRPIAATALVLLLRSSRDLDVYDAMVAESATYSMLQAGTEHAAWLATGPQSRRHRTPDDGFRVRVTRDASGVHIALARPARRNAIDAQMQRDLVDAFATAGDDERIFLTGDGDVFSSGGDLDEFGTRADPASAHLLRLTRSPARALAAASSRTTVTVQGACHGAGVELPAFARHVVARADATFTLPELGLGLIPGAGGTVSVPRRIGRHRAAWLMLTCQTIDVGTALEWGLVDDVIDG
jgi:enoyl-CoA hydratase/carnithine racemase